FARGTTGPTRSAASASSSTILITRASLSSLIAATHFGNVPARWFRVLLRHYRASCYRDNWRGGHTLGQKDPRRHRHLRTFPQRTGVRFLFRLAFQRDADRSACGRYRLDRRLVFP